MSIASNQTVCRSSVSRFLVFLTVQQAESASGYTSRRGRNVVESKDSSRCAIPPEDGPGMPKPLIRAAMAPLVIMGAESLVVQSVYVKLF